ncbi:hypothetical protein VKT23_002573 [Stygiomarasmius scandens]|uniref:Uncharacterized protein n=1 Tax=Marasmiellus scandens TaxID=2682957 RepID=A0ABR1K3K2_9AGAR
MPDLLGTKEGIEALIEFIKNSGAFTRSGKQAPEHKPPTYEPLNDIGTWDEEYNNSFIQQNEDNDHG